jgi:GTP-binding protein HflX
LIVIEKDRKTKTAVVCPIVKAPRTTYTEEDILFRKAEAEGLVIAMGQEVVFSDIIKINETSAATLFGSGTVNKLKAQCETAEAELLVVDGVLTPIQQRNLEKALACKVIDRTAVILEIFGRRAQTKEGKLQVELAHLTYQRGRLVRSWTHLERQRGGGGFLGGPGETQKELDRRALDTRILKIKKDLEKIKQTRSIQRAARVKVPYPTVALVGYTNAGKSTLFNTVTDSKVFAEDMLFATLDPTLRKIKLKGNKEVILSDTVGFISNLPHELVMAFRATLEEVLKADIIVHVIDCANPHAKEQRDDVLAVLHELGLAKIEYEENYIEVFNKIDLLDPEHKTKLKQKNAKTVCVSGLTGEGIHQLLDILSLKLDKCTGHETQEIKISAANGEKLAELYRTAEVLSRRDEEDMIYLTVKY